MMECVFRPQFHLGENSENHSLKTERSWAHHHQAKKETLKDLITYFTKYSKPILRNALLIAQNTKPCSKLF